MSEQPAVNERQGYLGGSDAAVILGVSPWKSRMQLCAEKKGVTGFELPPDKSALFFFGNVMEEPIGLGVERFFTLKLKRALNKDGTQRFFRSKKHAFMGGHIDFLEDADEPSFFVECKNVRFPSNEWGPMRDAPVQDDASELVPRHYLAQCRHYLALVQMQYCYLAALFGGCELRLYRINRDDDAERVLVMAERDFWDRYVVGDDLPESRTGADYEAAFKITKVVHAKRTIVCSEAVATELAELAEIRKKVKNLEERASVIRDAMVLLATGSPANFVDEEGNKLGNLQASVRQSPDVAAFKREEPDAFARYSKYVKTNAYFILRSSGSAEGEP